MKWTWRNPSPYVWRKLPSVSVPSHHTHVRRASLAFLLNNHEDRPRLFNADYILLNWKTQMLRRQMAMSDVQTAVWVARRAQTGANRCWQLRAKDGAKISTINIFKPSLVWMISKFSLALDTHTQHSMISWTCSWPLHFVYSATF